MSEPQNKPWWKESSRLASYVCSECSKLHCYWCGLPFVTDCVQRHPASPTREHVDARYENGKLVKSGNIRAAHALCNTLRGHQPWVPYHELGHRSERQLDSVVRLLDKVPELIRMERQ